MPNLTINGKVLAVDEGTTVLTACQSQGIEIPTLCYYKALKPYGGCRLCIVEIEKDGKTFLITSCTQPVEEGMVVRTDTDKIFKARQMLLRFLLLCAPNAERIKELAKEYDVREDRFTPEDKNCILCGLCTRMCGELMGVSAIGFVNRGAKKEVQTPFKKYSDTCTRCGACSFVCPTGKINLSEITDKEIVPNTSLFDEGLTRRPNIYIPYPQAVPNVPVIDEENCPYFLREKCGACQKFCDAGAIDYKEKDRTEEINTGAVVVSCGYDLFPAEQLNEYGYGVYPDVITSIQFERLLSSSGPTGGAILRPSDGKPPKKIAFIQCVGSRSINGGNEYCSSVCCMYSTKEAIIAREHDPEINPTIFFIDMRAFGKDYERYYESAEKEYGVRYTRCMVSKINENPLARVLEIKYIDEDGKIKEEEFDMVVLAIGIVPRKEIFELKEKLGLELNKYNFIDGMGYNYSLTNVPGIFMAGVTREPCDIPESVASGSAAASFCSGLVSSARGTQVQQKKYPKEKDVANEDLRIGVFVCHCGRNIAGVINVRDVSDFARGLKDVAYAGDLLYSCSQDGLVEIKKKIDEYSLNRVVVASCTPRTHETLFRDTVRETGLNPYLFEMTSIREQVSWVHRDIPTAATEKAKELVSMIVEKVRLARPIKRKFFDIKHSCLVIGGGVSGLTAALSIAKQGYEVYLVEKETGLGGRVKEMFSSLQEWKPQEILEGLVKEVKENALVHIYTNTEIKETKGYMGNFRTKILKEGAEEEELEHGAIIVATGAKENRVNEYFYGKDKRVITQKELEKLLYEKPQTIASMKSIVMVQCAGSRDSEHPYCSRVCCSHAIKNSLRIKEINPDAEVYVLYRDVRTYGFMEKYYLEAREKGIIFIRYEKDKKPNVALKNGKIRVSHFDPFLRDEIVISPDLVVLSVGMVPDGTSELSKILKVPVNSDGFFLEAHAKIRPLDFTTEGVYLCGTAHSPRHVEEAVMQANGAAIRAVTLLSKNKIETRAEIARVNEKKCAGCGICVTVCPYNAREIDAETNIAKVLEAVCQGCGACAIACPSGATEHECFIKKQILSMVNEV